MSDKWKEIHLHPSDQHTWNLFRAVIKKLDEDKKEQIKVSAINRRLSEIRKTEVRETYEFILKPQDDDPNIQTITALKEY